MPVLAARNDLKPSEWNDRELLTRVFRNDARGWAEMVRRFRPLIYRCITKVTGRYSAIAMADNDEIYAEVLMQLLRDDCYKLRVYNPARGTKLGSWIGLIAVNASYDYLRSFGRRPMLDKVNSTVDPHEECDRTPLDLLMEKERWHSFNAMLSEFSEKDRTFLELYYARGMEAEAVAEEMQISLKTVYSKKHKIRAHLQRCVERLSGESAIADLAFAS
ncbi:MAG: sigma-70 family RNA polymerase sigma factor [Deltaproteobacteria bacterium]|nr:sigma-70 family RNA polymerase sigma factor [Deltaproteobacteria bacterium]